jgi:hypothetical protein
MWHAVFLLKLHKLHVRIVSTEKPAAKKPGKLSFPHRCFTHRYLLCHITINMLHYLAF